MAWSTDRNDVAIRRITCEFDDVSKVAAVAVVAVGARSNVAETNIRLRPAERPLPLSTQPVIVLPGPMVNVPLSKTRLPVG